MNYSFVLHDKNMKRWRELRSMILANRYMALSRNCKYFRPSLEVDILTRLCVPLSDYEFAIPTTEVGAWLGIEDGGGSDSVSLLRDDGMQTSTTSLNPNMELRNSVSSFPLIITSVPSVNSLK